MYSFKVMHCMKGKKSCEYNYLQVHTKLEPMDYQINS